MEEKNKKYGWKYFLLELGVLVLGTAGMWILGGIRKEAADRLLGNCCMALFGLAVTGFVFRREYLRDTLDYNNGEHVPRFWLCVYMGLLSAFLCGFLPVGGWPFLVVFVMLSLFSNMGTGILVSSMLLMIAVLLSGGTVGSFVLYLVSGTFAAALFHHLEKDFKIGGSLCLSILCLLVCETANLVLVANDRPDFEMFVIPAANMIISSILLLGCLKIFSSMVVYQYREKYLDINDTENPVLAQLRQENKQEYMHSIHTAYFCERIAKRLGLDADALKSAGYYYRMGEKLPQLMEEKQFPPAVREILTEYLTRKKSVRKKETAVLVCSDTVVTSVLFMLEKGADKQLDFDRVIDAVFKKLLEDGSFDCCNITMEELRTMQRIFKEEKLYYDFLR